MTRRLYRSRKFEDACHIAGQAKHVNWQNRLNHTTACFVDQHPNTRIEGASLFQKMSELGSVDVQGNRVDVDEDRMRALVQNAIG